MKFTVGPDSELGAIVSMEIGSGNVVDIAIGRGTDVAADVGPDPAVVVACEVIVASSDAVEVIVVDVESLVDDTSALDVEPVGRI